MIEVEHDGRRYIVVYANAISGDIYIAMYIEMCIVIPKHSIQVKSGTQNRDCFQTAKQLSRF